MGRDFLHRGIPCPLHTAKEMCCIRRLTIGVVPFQLTVNRKVAFEFRSNSVVALFLVVIVISMVVGTMTSLRDKRDSRVDGGIYIRGERL
jgi:hypothetical protein